MNINNITGQYEEGQIIHRYYYDSRDDILYHDIARIKVEYNSKVLDKRWVIKPIGVNAKTDHNFDFDAIDNPGEPKLGGSIYFTKANDKTAMKYFLDALNKRKKTMDKSNRFANREINKVELRIEKLKRQNLPVLRTKNAEKYLKQSN